MISLIRIYLLCLQTALITTGSGVTVKSAKKQHVHGKFFCPSKANVLGDKNVEMSQNDA